MATLALSKPGAYLNANKRLALFQSAMQACDALDGLIDGLVSNQAACNATFDPATAMLMASPHAAPVGSTVATLACRMRRSRRFAR